MARSSAGGCDLLALIGPSINPGNNSFHRWTDSSFKRLQWEAMLSGRRRSGRNGESGPENRSLFSCCRIFCSVPAFPRDCGWRRTHSRLVDFSPLANFPADNVSRGGWWLGRRSHCLFDFRCGECGPILSRRGRFPFCLSPLPLATELMFWFFTFPISANQDFAVRISARHNVCFENLTATAEAVTTEGAFRKNCFDGV
jgi:hypothetical protein